MDACQVEKAVTSIYSKLSKQAAKYTEGCRYYYKRTGKPFIYKVQQQYLYNNNDKVHEPALIAIGPYHHGKQHLEMLEQIKHRYLYSFLQRKVEGVERYISAAAQIEQEARGCYAEPINLTADEFVEMLVLDACFIIELLRKHYEQDSGDDDPIFQMKWILHSVIQDLMLFENQIPFFVLCTMFDLIYGPSQHQTLFEQLFHMIVQEDLHPSKQLFIVEEDLHPSNWNNRNPEDVMHLLHLIYTVSRPSSLTNLYGTSPRLERRLIPSATALKDANIRFLMKREANERYYSTIQYEVSFENGTLTMPPLTIQNGTERYLKNLVVYEQYFPDNQPTYVTDYTFMLDCLVNTSKDVEILSECGIIENMMGNHQEAADVINRLGKSVMIWSGSDFIYSEQFDIINAHFYEVWNRVRAVLRPHYFNTPLWYVPFGAAVVLLLLTVAQTVLSALQM